MGKPLLLTFRDMMFAINPYWLNTGHNQKILYATGLQLDALGDAFSSGQVSRFPGFYSYQTLGLIAKERRLRQGLYEPNATFAERLTHWLDDHATRGGPYALLSQLWLHYRPNNFPIELVYRGGRRFVMDVDGNVTIDDTIPWNPGTPAARWAEWWLILHSDYYVAPMSANDIADARLIPREWNAAHTLGNIVIQNTGAEFIDTSGEINQAGTINTPVANINISVDG